MTPILLRRRFLCWALLVGSWGLSSAADAQRIEWSHQLEAGEDSVWHVAPDGLGNVYVTGHDRRVGYESIAFLSKYDAAGVLEWKRDFATTLWPNFYVAADKWGNVYVSGMAERLLDGDPYYGRAVVKFDATGTWQWTLKLSSDVYRPAPLATDGLGNFYLSGTREIAPRSDETEALVRKYDDAGNLLWTGAFRGSTGFVADEDVEADALGNVYLTGIMLDVLGADIDSFVAKFNSGGEPQWSHEIRTGGQDWVTDISADGLGNVYLSGGTQGSLVGENAGGYDGVVFKYDAAGTLEWATQFGSSQNDGVGVWADVRGNVLLHGGAGGELGPPHVGVSGKFISLYDDATGTPLWTRTLDSDYWEFKPDGLGNAYLVDMATRQNSCGEYELYATLTKIRIVPEPSSLGLVAAGVLVAGISRRTLGGI